MFWKKAEREQYNPENNLSQGEETIKISGTKFYVDIEYKGQAARFDGELGIGGFAATASSMSWIKHNGDVRDEEGSELMRAAYEYSKKQNKGLILFYDDENNIIEF